MSASIPGGSPFDLFVHLKAVSARIESASTAYWAEIDPVRDRFQAVMDTRGDPDLWPAAVAEAADHLRQSGLEADARSALTSERWANKMRAGSYAEAAAGYALAELLTAVLNGGGSDAFARYDGRLSEHPGAGTAAASEVCALFGWLLNTHADRVTERYVGPLREFLEGFDDNVLQLRWRLAEAGCQLSPRAALAVEHWDERRTTTRGRVYGGLQVVFSTGPGDEAATLPESEPDQGMQEPSATAEQVAFEPPAVKPKKSTTRGEARIKLIAVLTLHHRYADESCLRLEPIGNNELARRAGVSPSTASDFFDREFKGFERYKAICLSSGRLVAALKLLNNEFAPHLLYDSPPPTASTKDDEDDE